MENNSENKSIFFAQYYFQPVMGNITWHDKAKNKQVSSLPSDFYTGNYYLELKPLSSISDQDAKALGYPDARSATTTYMKILGEYSYEADYLRSKGYALPWMGLSVEKLIEYGWVKLK